MTLYVDGDPYILDPDSGEWIEQHHTLPTHQAAHA